jgi:futalosine hydrolase
VLRTSPASDSTRRCLVIAWRDTSDVALSCVIDPGPPDDNRTISRSRVSSPSAAKSGAASRTRVAMAIGCRPSLAYTSPMPDVARILVVSATAREMATARGWRTLLSGVGPVDAAATTAAEIARDRPSLILHVGIAGARRLGAFPPATLVIGTTSQYCDLAVPAEWAPDTILTASELVNAAQCALPSAIARAIGTSGRVGGTSGCDVEAMEGFGVLRAAQLAGVPAIEVRAISNHIEEPDRARWHFDAAFAAIVAATPLLVAELSLVTSA